MYIKTIVTKIFNFMLYIPSVLLILMGTISFFTYITGGIFIIISGILIYPKIVKTLGYKFPFFSKILSFVICSILAFVFLSVGINQIPRVQKADADNVLKIIENSSSIAYISMPSSSSTSISTSSSSLISSSLNKIENVSPESQSNNINNTKKESPVQNEFQNNIEPSYDTPKEQVNSIGNQTKLSPKTEYPIQKPLAETSKMISNGAVVKKSNSSICHAPGTTYYNRTKNFTPFNNLDDCLNSGGRLPLK